MQIKCVLIERVGRSKRDFDNGRRHRRHSCSQWWWIGRVGIWQRFFSVVCVVLGWKKGGRKKSRNNESKGQMSCQISETANCCEQSREYRWKGVVLCTWPRCSFLTFVPLLLFRFQPVWCVLHPWTRIPEIFRLPHWRNSCLSFNYLLFFSIFFFLFFSLFSDCFFGIVRIIWILSEDKRLKSDRCWLIKFQHWTRCIEFVFESIFWLILFSIKL